MGEVSVGSYIGNDPGVFPPSAGPTNTIGGLPFTPDHVLIRRASQVGPGSWVHRIRLAPQTQNLQEGGGTDAYFRITIGANSFTVQSMDNPGNAPELNLQGETYHYIALLTGAEYAVAPYVGDGTAGRVITLPFTPAWVWLTRETYASGADTIWKTDRSAADQMCNGWSGTQYPASDLIALETNGFRVNAGVRANVAGVIYWYMAACAPLGATAQYTGNNTADRTIVLPTTRPIAACFIGARAALWYGYGRASSFAVGNSGSVTTGLPCKPERIKSFGIGSILISNGADTGDNINALAVVFEVMAWSEAVLTYPFPPIPTGWGESLEWSTVTLEYDRVVRHVRRRTPVSLRGVRLSYTRLSPSEFAILRAFYEAVRGRARRFWFTHPITSETYLAKFADDHLAWGTKQALGPRIDVVATIKEAP